MTNRLAAAMSPYLRQHADNPVDWRPWGSEAFQEARRRDVPVFLSVGYSACHWCHVMAHESFEDTGVAAFLNEHFVSIKVDREEHPDVDATYMAATTALTGRGGWPMSVWLDHSGRAFHAGTYYPPQPRLGMPSFGQVLAAVSQAWRDRRGQVELAAARITAELVQRRAAAPSDVATGGGGSPGAAEGGVDLAEVTAEAVRRLGGDFDSVHGGFGGAPKFPPTMVLEFLLRHHARTGDRLALDMASATLTAMARGGVFDQLGGGFARYAVAADWVVPHFEKMLYDNAGLLRVYAHWWRATADPLARRVAEETAAFLLRDLRTAEGGFASAMDADSVPPAQAGREPGLAVEGACYVWSPAELADVLGPADGPWAAEVLGVTEPGTFEGGRSTLQLPADPADPTRWADVRRRLLAARARRPAPVRDDKVVAAWNGLAIAALADAGVIFDRPDWVAAAAAAADLLLAVHLTDHGGLLRVSRDGLAGSARGVLEDYADVADGLLALYQATAEPEWFGLAQGLLGSMVARFGAGHSDGGTATRSRLVLRDAEPDPLLPQATDPSDNAYPAGSSAAASALLILAALGGGVPEVAPGLFGRGGAADSGAMTPALVATLAPAPVVAAATRDAATTLVLRQADLMRRHARFAGVWLATAEALLAGPAEVAVLGPADDPDRAGLVQVVRRSTSPGLVLAVGEAGADIPPLLADRAGLDGRSTAYLCRGAVCLAPTVEPAVLAAQLVTGLPAS